MKYRIFSILTLLTLLLVSVVPLAAQNDAADFPLTIEDRLGEEFTFEEAPQRIVCFYSGCLRGLGPLIAGTDITVAWPYEDLGEFADEEYYPGLAEDVVILEDGGDLDPEVIAAFDPDLIIAFSEEDKTTYGTIAPVFAEYDVTSAADVFETFIDYGRIIGMADEAEEVAADVRERFEAYQALVPGDRTFMTIGNEGGGTLWLRTNNSSECFVLDGLAECNWPDPTGGESWSYQATTEAVFNLNPDVIYMANWSSESETEVLLEDFVSDPLIAETDAAQNGRIYNVAGYDNPTGQGVMAMKQLLDVYMPLIYPDIFPDGPLTDEQVQDILAEQEADNSVSGAGFPVTVIDGDGEELTFNAPPERVVCLDNKCVEDMAFIGVMPYAVGAPNPYNIANDPVNFGKAAANLIQISSNDGGPNFEQVAAAQPDLIVGWSELRPTAEGIAPFFSLIYGDGTLEGAFRDTRALAAILGRSEEVEEKIVNLTNRIDAYDELVSDDTSILITFTDGDLRQFWLPTQEGFAACWVELIAECASIGEAEFSTGGYGDYEALLALDPDVIVLQDFAQDPEAMTETLNTLDENSLWRELSAVKKDKIFVATPTTSRFTSPQGASNALEYLIPRIFPDIFPDGPLTDEQVQEILAEAETE